ncbi:MAG: hypothetical protein JWR05_3527 [Mucilaginibacter sp.]|nr:hypothetical protein [Mucilaginibacter sp.]
MEKVIEAIEETVKQAQWHVNYHEEELRKAKEKRDYLLEGLSIIKGQQEEPLPI